MQLRQNTRVTNPPMLVIAPTTLPVVSAKLPVDSNPVAPSSLPPNPWCMKPLQHGHSKSSCHSSKIPPKFIDFQWRHFLLRLPTLRNNINTTTSTFFMAIPVRSTMGNRFGGGLKTPISPARALRSQSIVPRRCRGIFVVEIKLASCTRVVLISLSDSLLILKSIMIKVKEALHSRGSMLPCLESRFVHLLMRLLMNIRNLNSVLLLLLLQLLRVLQKLRVQRKEMQKTDPKSHTS